MKTKKFGLKHTYKLLAIIKVKWVKYVMGDMWWSKLFGKFHLLCYTLWVYPNSTEHVFLMAQTLEGGSGLLFISRSDALSCQAWRVPGGSTQLSNINKNLAEFPLDFLNMHAICFYQNQKYGGEKKAEKNDGILDKYMHSSQYMMH